MSELEKFREQALQHYRFIGLPTRQQEDWKYTSVPNIDLVQKKSTQKITLAEIKKIALTENFIVFLNGYFEENLSKAKVKTINQVDDVNHYFEQTFLDQKHGLIELNNALFSDGVFLEIEKNKTMQEPIEILFIQTDSHCVSYPRNLISLAENSHACVIEHYYGNHSKEYFVNSLTEIKLAENATLDHIKIIAENSTANHFSLTSVLQAKSSIFKSHQYSLSGQWIRADVQTNLQEPYAQCQLNGLYLTRDQQHIDHHTRINHASTQTKSDEYYKGIMRDKSQAVFNGKVIVEKNAMKTDAKQYNKNLLLSKLAEIDTKPELEIYADDVKCAHGATVGQLDENMLFYLRARGLDQKTAENFLLQAFIFEITERLPIKIKNLIEILLREKYVA